MKQLVRHIILAETLSTTSRNGNAISCSDNFIGTKDTGYGSPKDIIKW